jgi:hypothetical protein
MKLHHLQENGWTGYHQVELDKPNSESQTLHVLLICWNQTSNNYDDDGGDDNTIVKEGLLGGKPMGGERGKGKGDRGWIWFKYVTYMQENSIMKPTKNLQRGSEEGKENNIIDGVKLIKVHYIICLCASLTMKLLLQLMHDNKIFKNFNFHTLCIKLTRLIDYKKQNTH